MREKLFNLSWLLVVVLLMSSCSEDLGGNFRSKPKALGVINQLTVICDDELWEGALGDSARYYFESVYPILPRPEPLLDVRQFSPFEIKVEPLRRELRTYLFCASLEDTSSLGYKMLKEHLGDEIDSYQGPKLKMANDRWATDQVIFYMVAPDASQLASSVSQYFPTITERVNKHDKKQLNAKTYIKGHNASLSKKVQESMGIYLDLPADYVEAQTEDDFMWLRRDFEDITMNLLIHKMAYESQDQFDQTHIKALIDTLGRTYVSSTSANSYMKVNDIDLPLYSSTRDINGLYAAECRGIWEMANDFMGGPFVAFLIHLPESQELLLVEGFILAPGRSKRDLMQQFEVILESLRTS